MPSPDLLHKLIIDRKRGSPLHTQVLREVRQLISRHFVDGDPFFTDAQLVEGLGVSRATVRQALAELSREGMLLRRRSSGTIVCIPNRPGGAKSERRDAAIADRMQVGIVVSAYDSETQSMLLQKLAEICRTRDMTVNMYYSHRDEDLRRVYRQISARPDVERFILFSDAGLGSALWDGGYKTVTIERPSENYQGAAVETDARMAVRIGVQYLQALGHTRIALLVNDPSDQFNVREKRDEFSHLLPDAPIIICGTRMWESSYKAAYAHMPEMWPDSPSGRPTAIIATSDPGAWAALRWLSEHNIPVPESVSVLGFEGSPSSQFMHPALSTIAHPIEALAKVAMDVLWSDTVAPTTTRLAPGLIVRKSTGRVATSGVRS